MTLILMSLFHTSALLARKQAIEKCKLKKMVLIKKGKILKMKCLRPELNRRPRAYKARAITTMLRRLYIYQLTILYTTKVDIFIRLILFDLQIIYQKNDLSFFSQVVAK